MRKGYRAAAVLTASVMLLTACQNGNTTHEPETMEVDDDGGQRSSAGGRAIADFIGGLLGKGENGNSEYSSGVSSDIDWESSYDYESSWSDSSSDWYSESGQEEQENQDDGTLTILTWDTNSDVQKMVDYFIEMKGYDRYKVNIVTVPDAYDAVNGGYNNYFYGDEDIDLVILEGDYADNFIDTDWLMPLSDIGLFRSDFSDAFQYTLDLGTNQNQDLMAVTYAPAPGGFLYRSDLAKQYLGVNSPEEMQEKINSWGEFMDTARELYDSSNGEVKISASLSGLWQAYRCKAVPWVQNGEVVYNPNAEYFMDIANSLYSDNYVEDAERWYEGWYMSVYGGEALGEFVPSWGLLDYEYSLAGEMSNKGKADLAFCMGPEGYYWGGTMIAVADKCNDPTLAREFIEMFCTDTYYMGDFYERTGIFMNSHTVANSYHPYNSYLDNDDYNDWLVKSADRVIAKGHSMYDSRIADRFYDAVLEYCKGSSYDDVMDSFQKDIVTYYPDLYFD